MAKEHNELNPQDKRESGTLTARTLRWGFKWLRKVLAQCDNGTPGLPAVRQHSTERMSDGDTKQARESGIRKFAAEVYGRRYEPLRSLYEAKSHKDGVVVLEGDWGGIIYLTCPASLVRCSEEALHQLLLDLDGKVMDEPDGAQVFYERLEAGESIMAGSGGAVVTDGIWVHERLKKFRLEEAISEVIRGRRGQVSSGAGNL